MLKISVDLTNIGKLKGEEVTQLHIGFKNSSVDRPIKFLRGFQKEVLNPGERKKIIFEIPAKDLAWYNPQNKKLKKWNMKYMLEIFQKVMTF